MSFAAVVVLRSDFKFTNQKLLTMKEFLQKWGASNKRMALIAMLTLVLVAIVAWVQVIKPYIDEKKALASGME